MGINLKDELAAYKSLTELLTKAEETRILYQTLRLPLPDPLRRLLGSNGNSAVSGSAAGKSHIASPIPPMPPEAESDWAWVKVEECSPHTLVKAVLRRDPEPTKSKDIYEKVVALGLRVSLGTVSNAATRLQTYGILDRDDENRWLLKKTEEAGIIHEGYVWGPRGTFTSQELAAHRREAILYILSKFPGGLQMAQITAQLQAADWLRAEVNKYLTKGDVENLAGANKIHRIAGHSKKWQLTQHEEAT